MEVTLRPFLFDDYPAALALWRTCEGVVLRAVDEPEPMRRYLERNAGMSVVAEVDGRVVGTLLAGTDGRRGYLQHLAVAAAHRRRGLGRALVGRALAALAAVGVDKCHLLVVADQEVARAFWMSLGWEERRDVRLLSRAVGAQRDA